MQYRLNGTSTGVWLGALLLTLALSVPVVSWAETEQPVDEETLYPPVQIGAASQEIPAGARLVIRFLTALDSKTANIGDAFSAEASEDLWIEDRLILPKGTAVRGRVEAVQRPGFFSKGGLLKLGFDHMVMPSGELRPLSLQLDTASAKMDRQRNALYTDPGVGAKLDKSVQQAFSSQCLRAGSFKPSEPKTW